MKKYVIFLLLFSSYMPAFGQSIDVGLEAQQNTNQVQKWLLTDDLSEFNRAFSLLDINQDTINVYFNTFSMTNNFEIPVYFRYNFKKRFFFDFKLSNQVHTLYMEGVSNYSDSYFTENYGTYNDFVLQAESDGFTNVDTSDYQNYINGAKAEHQRDVRSREEFKVLSMTTNIGIRLLPHRSVKPYITFGYTLKSKYQKFSYQHFDFSHPNVHDIASVNEGVNKFSGTTNYFNFGLGVEFYRFRVGVYYQVGLAFQATDSKTNSVVVDVNSVTPFQNIQSYGFTMCANLFSTPVGRRVVYEGLADEEIVLSNIERKKYKSDFAIRFGRRGFNNITTYYATPDNRLSILSMDSVLINNGGTIISAEKMQMITVGDVKRIFWSGQFDLVYNRYFGKRFALEVLLGVSTLTTDLETTELLATVVRDTAGTASFLYSGGEPRLRSGVYRTVNSMTHFDLGLSYKLIDKDLFGLTLLIGSGWDVMFERSLSFVDLPDGVNDMAIYDVLDENYYALDNTALYGYQGAMAVDLNASPDDVISKFNGTKLDSSWPTPQPQRFKFPTSRFAVEATLDRFLIGLNVTRSTTYMDGFLLKNYTSVSFSLGYKIYRRPAK